MIPMISKRHLYKPKYETPQKKPKIFEIKIKSKTSISLYTFG